MKNRFKFRIWNGAEMHYNDFVVTPTGYVAKLNALYDVEYDNEKDEEKEIQSENEFMIDNSDLDFEKDKILMQCTGLKDKNGKLIYEGDIIKINTWLDKIVPDDFEYRYESEKGFALYQIFFNQEKARFEAKCIKYTKVKPYRCFLLEYVPTNNEVIGNIYENEDLLKCENQ